MRSRPVIVSALLLAATAALFAQEESIADSLKTSIRLSAEARPYFSRPVPLSVPWLEQEQGFETSLPYLLAPVSIAPFPLLVLDDQMLKPDLTAALRLQLAREESNRTLYTVLGTVQIGGVAYLAYRHIKKYGFMK